MCLGPASLAQSALLLASRDFWPGPGVGTGPGCSFLLRCGWLFCLPGWDLHGKGAGSWAWAAHVLAGCFQVNLGKHGGRSCIELSFMGDDHSIARKARGERGGKEEPGGWKACSAWSCGVCGTESRPPWVGYDRHFSTFLHSAQTRTKHLLPARFWGSRGSLQRHGSTLSDLHTRMCFITVSAKE